MADLAIFFCGFRHDLGIYVRSKWEANFARYLNYCEEHYARADWWYEKETFQFPVKRGTQFYKPDSKVLNTDKSADYYEVKDYLDQKSRNLLKKMVIYHLSVKVVAIDEAFSRALVRQGHHELLSGWER